MTATGKSKRSSLGKITTGEKFLKMSQCLRRQQDSPAEDEGATAAVQSVFLFNRCAET